MERIDTTIEYQIEQEERRMATEMAKSFLPHFNWLRVRSQWKGMSSRGRFIALNIRRVQLKGIANAVISREVLEGYDRPYELIFRPGVIGAEKVPYKLSNLAKGKSPLHG